MGRYYTEKDVERWEKVDKEIGRLHLDKLAANPPQQQVDFRLSMLSNECQARGMTCIARGRFSEAMVCFRQSVEWLCKMYDRWEKGVGRAMEAGHYQSLLLAHVVNDDELINGFARHYRADAGTDDSMYLGPILKCITLKDLDGARSALAQKKPRKFERQFTGYPDCFEAIIDKDQTRFVEFAPAAIDCTMMGRSYP